ncbi:MAG: hypothetical protein LBG27_11810 [Spirochaetaceae bacterium]|nr:hypothetical protein [Spirochaetaceae bacterium]
MTNKNLWMGLLAGLLTVALVLAGCDNGSGGGGDDPPTIELPPIDEPTTGQETVTYTGVSISGLP